MCQDFKYKGSDHVTSGQMKSLKKPAPDGTEPQNHTETDGHGDSMNESVQWGRFSENWQKTI